MNDANRAHDIIWRIRDLIKKAPPQRDRLNINETIQGVIDPQPDCQCYPSHGHGREGIAKRAHHKRSDRT
jgi:hypothetical protein